MDSSIFTYVKNERARGISDQDIRAELLAKGWKHDDVELAISGDSFTFKKLLIPGKPASRMGRKQYIAIFLSFISSVVIAIFFIAVAGGLWRLVTGVKGSKQSR